MTNIESTLNSAEILNVIDQKIKFWRDEFCKQESLYPKRNTLCYIDALQSLRKSLFGSVLDGVADEFRKMVVSNDR